MKPTFTLPAVVAVVLALPGVALAGQLDPGLEKILADTPADQPRSVLVFLTDQVDLNATTAQLDAQKADLRRRHEVVVRSLQAMAQATQVDLVNRLETAQRDGQIEELQPFWISNCVRVDATKAVIEEIAARPDVGMVYFNYPIEHLGPRAGREGTAQNKGARDDRGPRTPETGVDAVRAPEVWAMGYTGEGILIATLDTGVDGDHPALASRWRGVADPGYIGHPEWAWFDPVTYTTFPTSFGAHGTHTMGSACGGPPGDEIGVAPGAQWIHAAVIDRVSISETVADSIEAFQWMLDPDEDPATNWDVPAVCSNSWGVTTAHGYMPCDPTLWSYLDACEVGGIVVLFSAGNEGPGASTLRRPADRATTPYRTCAVGGIDANEPGWPMYSSSSRGPSDCTPGGEEAIKPDINAPAVDVRSSVPGGGYESYGWTGTSMASPHVCGVVALMRQACAQLTVTEIIQILYDTAFDLGPPGKDNDYGWGMVDAYEAVQMALDMCIGLHIEFPNGVPEVLPRGEPTTIDVQIVLIGQTLMPESALLHYRYQPGSYQSVPLVSVEEGLYQATLPAGDCDDSPYFYFSAEGSETGVEYQPPEAPQWVFRADVGEFVMIMDDNFETDFGWTIANIDLDDGAWERGAPAGDGQRGDPLADFDESGQCYLTDNELGDSDVDGGPTRLQSPTLDVAGKTNPVIKYARWWTNDDQDEDRLNVEISDNDGVSWALVETVPHTEGWVERTIHLTDYVAATAQVKVRFSATDNPNNSISEGAIDAFKLWDVSCYVEGDGDFDANGHVDLGDFGAFQICFGLPSPGGCEPGDLDANGMVDLADFIEFAAAMGGP